MNAPVLDTHIWIWWMLGAPDLNDSDRAVLDNFPAHDRPIISAISLWEFATLVDLGRLSIAASVEDWLSIAASPATVTVQPITPAVVAEMNRLPNTFHRDPADLLILATARSMRRPLATMDRKILQSQLTPLWGNH